MSSSDRMPVSVRVTVVIAVLVSGVLIGFPAFSDAWVRSFVEDIIGTNTFERGFPQQLDSEDETLILCRRPWDQGRARLFGRVVRGN